MKTWKVVGINFDHMHMGDLLRMVLAHARAELVGVSDPQPDRVWPVLERLRVDKGIFVADARALLAKTRPDVAVLCPATAEHGMWTELAAGYGVHVIIEKPFAASLAEADRMIAAMRTAGKELAVNWPIRWYPPHVTAKRLIDEGLIGEPLEVHHYGGNRGPLRHLMDKIETSDEEASRQKSMSWFYQKDKGGGSLLDYLGYGTTLGTWFLNGKKPLDVMCMVDRPAGLEVDEHSVTVARFEDGLSKYETRWGTFTDPWTLQPQPKTGFVVVGREGTIALYEYEDKIRVQTRQRPEGFELPVDALEPPRDNPVNYVLDRLEAGQPIEGPLSPAIARIGQQIVDTAMLSAREGRMVPLLP